MSQTIEASETREPNDPRDPGEAVRQAVLRSMVEGIVIHDAKGVIIYANPAAEQILGLTLDELMGRTSMDERWKAVKLNGAELAGEEHPAMIVLRTGRSQKGVTIGVAGPRGSRRWLKVNAEPVWSGTPRALSHVVATFEDVTEPLERERALRESEARLQVALELGGAATWELDVAEQTFHASRTLNQFFGRKVDYQALTDFWSIFHPDDLEEVKAAWKAHLKGGPPMDVEHRIEHRNGTTRWVRAYSMVVGWDQGKPSRFIGFFKEVPREPEEQ